MRLLTLSKLLAIGATAVYAYKHRHRLPLRRRRPQDEMSEDAQVTAADLVPDPGDPVQGFDEVADLHVIDLDLDAVDAADAAAAQDLAALENDVDDAAMEIDTPSQTTLDAIDDSVRGVPDVLDDDDAFDDGQNWVEALETSAAEYGPDDPEVDVDITDDPDEPRRMRGDTPVADHGSGGPRGV